MDLAGTASRSIRLGIIHFLGWTLGCAVVLAIFRAIGEAEQVPSAMVFRVRLIQMGFGLAYGTAISGLGLFVWRWWAGEGPGPTQPGHWLILFGGVGLILDLGLGGGVKGMLLLLGKPANDWRFFFWHRSIGWSIGSLILLTALVQLRGTTRPWTAFVAVSAAMMAVTAAVHMTSLICLANGAKGTWPWYVPAYVSAALPVVGLLFLWPAEIADRIRGLERDWLHGGGIAAVSALAAVSFAAHWHLFWT